MSKKPDSALVDPRTQRSDGGRRAARSRTLVPPIMAAVLLAMSRATGSFGMTARSV